MHLCTFYCIHSYYTNWQLIIHSTHTISFDELKLEKAISPATIGVVLHSSEWIKLLCTSSLVYRFAGSPCPRLNSAVYNLMLEQRVKPLKPKSMRHHGSWIAKRVKKYTNRGAVSYKHWYTHILIYSYTHTLTHTHTLVQIYTYTLLLQVVS